MFVATENKGIIRHLGGGFKTWPIGNLVVNFNGSARLHSSKKAQSTSDWLGGGRIVQCMEKRLRVEVCIFSWRGGFNPFPPRCAFGVRFGV
jgi:hypothetical protein